VRRVSVIATASCCGKTTLGLRLAARLGVRFVELDALHHGPNWTEASRDELRAKVEPILATEGWVIDGGYQGKIGTIVQDAADTVVWLDLPRRVWLPRLIRRTTTRIVRREELWNGNRESFRTALLGRDGLILYSLRQVRRRREEYPVRFASHNVVRLRSQKEVDRWLARFD
jgi:adenylate kinase family enzyme